MIELKFRTNINILYKRIVKYSFRNTSKYSKAVKWYSGQTGSSITWPACRAMNNKTNKIPRYSVRRVTAAQTKASSRGGRLVQLNYWDPLWRLSFCQHGSEVRNEDEATGGGEDYERLLDVGMRRTCGNRPRARGSSPTLQVLNV